MRRRRFLAGLATAPALSFAGCVSDETGDVPASGRNCRSETADGGGTPTDEDTPTRTENTEADRPAATDTDGGSGVVGTGFEVGASECGQQREEATVSFDDRTVTVTGTVWGNDLTYTAALDSAAMDDGTLVVTVVARPDDEGGLGGQCITEIDYEATVTLDRAGPEAVRVCHRRGDETTTVATVER